jgi:imidazolonepropionase-like amidohydrolase
VADSADEIRKQVRMLVAEGADAIKLVASGGGTKGGIPYLASYTADELRVGVEAAHALERRTVAHARAAKSIENCVDAGLDAEPVRQPAYPGWTSAWRTSWLRRRHIST